MARIDSPYHGITVEDLEGGRHLVSLAGGEPASEFWRASVTAVLVTAGLLAVASSRMQAREL